jgi:hypothetical protein
MLEDAIGRSEVCATTAEASNRRFTKSNCFIIIGLVYLLNRALANFI